ncbi:MAG: tyrosine-type recombinase/integrase [Solirubrobacteraceae bacterium]
MPAKLDKTNTPGVYRRHAAGCARGRCDCAYVVIWRHRGKQRKESYRTLAEAREAKRQRDSQAARREFAPVERIMLHEYANGWIDRYQGTGRRGFREETRSEYRTLLDKYALSYFSATTSLTEIGPGEIAQLIGWLVKQPNGRGGTLSDKSVRNALGPLRACLASAKREGKLTANPVVGAALPYRPRIEEDDELPRPFPRVDGAETMELVVSLVHPAHRLMFELLAATGLRRSELLALEARHLALSGAEPHVKVRQRTRWQKGQGQVMGALKSRHARRDLPIPVGLADQLAARVAGREPDALVFAGLGDRPYDPHHLHLRVLSPACAEAGVEWAGFHTFRHTIASRMFAAGRNAVQVQHWLGHHSAAFTLATYVHLLDGDLGGPVEPVRGNTEATDRPKTAANAEPLVSHEMAD